MQFRLRQLMILIASLASAFAGVAWASGTEFGREVWWFVTSGIECNLHFLPWATWVKL
jgi:hypothetical protein